MTACKAQAREEASTRRETRQPITCSQITAPPPHPSHPHPPIARGYGDEKQPISKNLLKNVFGKINGLKFFLIGCIIFFMNNKKCKCGAINPDDFYSYQKNICKKCHGQKVLKRYHSMDLEKKKSERSKHRNWIKKNYLYYRLINTKSRSKNNGISFNITIEDVQELWEKQGGRCYYTNQPMVLGPSERKWNSVSIDRVDSSGGYEVDNVVLCRGIVNLVKNELSVDELLEVIEQIKTTFEARKNLSQKLNH